MSGRGGRGRGRGDESSSGRDGGGRPYSAASPSDAGSVSGSYRGFGTGPSSSSARGGGGRDTYGAGAGRGGGGGNDGGRGGGGGGYGGGGRGGGRAGPPAHILRQRNTTQDEVRATWASLFKGLRAVNPHVLTVDGHVKRPDKGTLGHKVTVLANHFTMKTDPGLMVRQYDVAIVRQRTPKSDKPQSMPNTRKFTRPPPPEPAPGEEFADVGNSMPEKNLCYQIILRLAQVENWPPQFCYDGQKLLFTAQRFALGDEATYVVEHQEPGRGRPSKYLVKIQPTGFREVGANLDAFYTDPEVEVQREELRDSLQALDVALRMKTACDPTSRIVGRGVFWKEGAIDLGWGSTAWPGYTQTLQLTQSGLSFIMDTSRCPLPRPDPLIDWACDVLNVRGGPRLLGSRALTSQQLDTLKAALRNKPLTVEVTHRQTGRLRHKVLGFTATSARECMFPLDDGTGAEMSVEDYFEKKYTRLNFPLLPCAIVGDRTRPEWLPFEFCNIIMSSGRRAITGDEMRELIKASEPPQTRAENILKFLKTKANFPADSTALAFGLRLQTPNGRDVDANNAAGLMVVPARVLPGPRLEYGRGSHVDPGTSGFWNLMGQTFYKPATLKSVAIVSWVAPRALERQDGSNLMDEFKNEFVNAMKEKGMVLDFPARIIPVVQWTRNDTEKMALDEGMRAAQVVFKQKAQLLIVIQERYNQVYGKVKYHCDSELGVQSQCLVGPNLGIGMHAPPGAMGRKLAGVALKVNTKLGGENVKLPGGIGNWCPALTLPDRSGNRVSKRVMFLGADVSHPTNLPSADKPTDGTRPKPDMPSVAAVVGSVNRECTRFLARILVQDPLVEEINEMASAVEDLLLQWCRHNTQPGPNQPIQLPDSIIMFRDGISEGQFVKMLDLECAAIRQACTAVAQRLKVTYDPKITFATVQKRHNTRFFPHSPESFGPDGKNIAPGIVVDQSVCNPNGFDYYLNSHKGLQGTNKPAKYHVLRDENNLTADSMQLLTHWLSHTFCRCTSAVSYCPPAYYAHHAAFRARCLLRQEQFGSGSETTSQSGDTQGSIWRSVRVHPDLVNTMYYI